MARAAGPVWYRLRHETSNSLTAAAGSGSRATSRDSVNSYEAHRVVDHLEPADVCEMARRGHQLSTLLALWPKPGTLRAVYGGSGRAVTPGGAMTDMLARAG